MSPTAFFTSLLVVWTLCYTIVPGWLVIRGWIVTGGTMQFIGALLPGIWQGTFWPNEAGDFGLLMMILLPLPLFIIVIGCVVNVVRLGTKVRERVRRSL